MKLYWGLGGCIFLNSYTY